MSTRPLLENKALDFSADLCVVGAGPAGMITVLEYSRLNPRKSVILIEFGYTGQPDTNHLDDSIHIDNLINHHDPYECTNKGLGGTSLTWGGRCVMYDDIDFIKRSSVDDECTWDLALFDEVKKFAGTAAGYFECGDPVFNLHDIPSRPATRIAEHFREGIVTDTVVERWSMPTRFGKRYGDAVRSAPNVTILDGYEARDLAAPDEHGSVASITVRHVVSRKEVTISAGQFVIAAGAQETTRVLLRNTQVFRILGYVPEALGKYYQGHVFGKIASVIFSGDAGKTEYGFIQNTDGSYMRRRFQFDSQFLLANDLLNTAIWLDNPLYHDPKHRNGAMSFMYLAMITPLLGKRLAPPAIAYSITKGRANKIGQHLLNIVRDLPGSLLTPATLFYKRYCLTRKLPGIFLFSRENTYALNFHAEQVPRSQNRMELESDGETLAIKYQLTDADVSSVIRIHEVLDQWLRECGCGHLDYWYKKDTLGDVIRDISKDGIHQIGTTRIADSPSQGVVDRNLLLWGTRNVFVCSSSVFPTSGQANPTFFLGAFAARLASHLGQ